MTSTLGETDLDWLTLIDYELEVPCESMRGCDKTAEWKFISKCCGAARLFCSLHKELEIRFVETHVDTVLVCKSCKHNYGTGNLISHVYDIQPL